MNKKMKIFIICLVFVLIISCKNYASNKDKDVKSLEQSEQDLKEKVKGFLDLDILDSKNVIKDKELVGGFENFDDGLEVKVAMQGDQPQEQVDKGVFEDSKLKEEIEKEIQELKEKVEKSDRKTPIGKYCEYEEEIKKIRENLKDKLEDLEDKEKFETELKKLEDSLKKKKAERKNALEEAKKEFEKFKGQVSTATGETYGHQVQTQGKIGGQAWSKAKELGLNGSYSNSSSTNSNNFTNEVIEDALKKIEEELRRFEKDKKE